MGAAAEAVSNATNMWTTKTESFTLKRESALEESGEELVKETVEDQGLLEGWIKQPAGMGVPRLRSISQQPQVFIIRMFYINPQLTSVITTLHHLYNTRLLIIHLFHFTVTKLTANTRAAWKVKVSQAIIKVM